MDILRDRAALVVAKQLEAVALLRVAEQPVGGPVVDERDVADAVLQALDRAIISGILVAVVAALFHIARGADLLLAVARHTALVKEVLDERDVGVAISQVLFLKLIDGKRPARNVAVAAVAAVLALKVRKRRAAVCSAVAAAHECHRVIVSSRATAGAAGAFVHVAAHLFCCRRDALRTKGIGAEPPHHHGVCHRPVRIAVHDRLVAVLHGRAAIARVQQTCATAVLDSACTMWKPAQ